MTPVFNCNIQLFLQFSYFDINSICNLNNELLESNSEEEISMFTENFETVIIKL